MSQDTDLRHNFDSPLDNPKHDCLDRADFAKRIYTIIKNTPISSNVRIGIYGDWGSGKTTVMNFIKSYCRDELCPVATFSPWRFSTKEEAREGFVKTIDKAIADWKHNLLGEFQRRKIVKNTAKWARNLANASDVPFAKLIGEGILNPLEKQLVETKEAIQKYLDKILDDDKRLFIYIDDLDRASPEIIYEFLMLLNEIIDFKRCIYVIGIDKNVASEIVGKRVGGRFGSDFLEKIITWGFEVPNPSDFQLKELLKNELGYLHKSVRAKDIKEIFEFLPRNPRKFKHYLRLLNSLHQGFLYRFNDNELDWKMLYLAQLIRFEFPEQFNSLMRTGKLVDDLAGGYFSKRIMEATFGSGKKEKPEWLVAIESVSEQLAEDKKTRFTHLTKYLVENSKIYNQQHLKNHLLVIEMPELLTWKEYSDIMKGLDGLSKKQIKTKLDKYFKSVKSEKDVELRREFLKSVVREREELHSKLTDVNLQDKKMVQRISKIMVIMDILLDVKIIFDEDALIFDAATFNEWFSSLIRWLHFTTPKNVYKQLRLSERLLLKKLVKNISLHPTTTLTKVRSFFRNLHGGTAREARPLFDELEKIIETPLIYEILKRFEIDNSMTELWQE